MWYVRVVYRVCAAFTMAYLRLDKSGQATVNKQMHDWVVAELAQAPQDSFARRYTGALVLRKKALDQNQKEVAVAVGKTLWLQPDGSWFGQSFRVFRNFIAEPGVKVPCLCAIPCGRAPRAEQYVDAQGQMQVAVVAEARYQFDPLNRAMNKEAASKALKAQIALLNQAVSSVRRVSAVVCTPLSLCCAVLRCAAVASNSPVARLRLQYTAGGGSAPPPPAWPVV